MQSVRQTEGLNYYYGCYRMTWKMLKSINGPHVTSKYWQSCPQRASKTKGTCYNGNRKVQIKRRSICYRNSLPTSFISTN
jgi:hypothetical protein